MENPFDFQIDFDALPTIQDVLETPEASEPHEDTLSEEIMQGKKKAYRCTFPQCGKIFQFKSAISRHIIIHQKERPYQCTYPDCNKSFKRADAVENHMRTHTGVQPYLCEIPDCGQRFATKAALRYHQIRHNNNRAFKCDFPSCDKAFLTLSQLKQHHKAFESHRTGLEEKMPEKAVKIQTQVQDVCKEVLPVPAELVPKEQDNIISWEMKTMGGEDEDLSENAQQEKFEKIFEFLVSENKLLKEKLQQREKKPVVVEHKEKHNLECNVHVGFPHSLEFNNFFDEEEMQFLDFLKGQEDNLLGN